MAGTMSVEQMTAKTNSLSARLDAGASDDAFASDVNAAAENAKAELRVDYAARESARQAHDAKYSGFATSGMNPVNWFTDLEARADARINVWPLDAEVNVDQEQVLRLNTIQNEVTKRILRTEEAETLGNFNALRTQYSDSDAAAGVAQIVASTGMKVSDATAAAETFHKTYGNSEVSVPLVGVLARINKAYADSGSAKRLTPADVLAECALTSHDWSNEACITFVETFLFRVKDAEAAGPVTENDKAKLRASITADVDAFYQLHNVDRAGAAVLASLVGSPTPTREAIVAHYNAFYAVDDIDHSTAIALTALVAPNDGDDTRDLTTRRQEALNDRKMLRDLNTRYGGIDSDSMNGALAAYRDSSIDFNAYIALLWFYRHETYSNYASGFADAATQRHQRTRTTSRLSRLPGFAESLGAARRTQ
jgi:hypothetical protein